MLMPLLLLLAATQVPTSGPPMPPQPRTPAVQRTGDATVLGSIGAADANAIEVGTLAEAKASAGAVKALAATLREEHERSLTAGTALAKQYRITRLLPNDSAMARRQVRVMVELNTRSGASFDRAFVEWVVANHQALLSKDEQLLQSERTRAAVKRFLGDRLPMLRRHVATAEAWLVANPAKVAGAAP
jgi:putative membrane protein